MEIRDTREWEEATDKVFNECGDLLDESGVKVVYIKGFTGPGGDYDTYEIKIKGCDSGEARQVYADIDTWSGFGPQFDVWEFAQELADYIAESCNGEVVDWDNPILIEF